MVPISYFTGLPRTRISPSDSLQCAGHTVSPFMSIYSSFLASCTAKPFTHLARVVDEGALSP